MKVQVARYNPETDSKPHYETYNVTVQEGARILNVLDAIHDTIDSTLGYRHCCRGGQCGSCAVRVNGEPTLACQKEAKDGDVIEPLNIPLIRDLITDIAPVIAQMAWMNTGCTYTPVTREEIENIKPLRSCIECYSCISSCPAVESSTYAGPTIMRQEQRLNLDPRDIDTERIEKAIEKGLFSCTTCRKCVEVCPKKIDTPKKAVEKLREVAVRKGLALPAHKSLAKLIEDTGRSVDKIEKTFLEMVPDVIEPDGPVRATVGFFVGCVINGRNPQTALDAIEVLKRNGIRVIIPKTQVCCGSPLIRTGFTGFIPELQERNIKAFEDIDTVITICAGCGSTLKNDYTTPFRVADITEYLVEIGYEIPGKIKGTFTYHDPCHLLRGQGIKDQPRQIIRDMVENFVDMPARCCGAGGGVKSGQPDEAAKIGKIRAEMVKKTGADTVVTVCPFCGLHLHQVTGLPTMNIVSLMYEGYRKK